MTASAGPPAPSINCCRNRWQALQALVAATPARPAPEPVPPMPAALSPDGERPLLEAIARSYPFEKQIETKEQTGQVRALEAARIEANLDQAEAGSRRHQTQSRVALGGRVADLCLDSQCRQQRQSQCLDCLSGWRSRRWRDVSPVCRSRHTAGGPRRRSDRRDSWAAAERPGKAATRCGCRCRCRCDADEPTPIAVPIPSAAPASATTRRSPSGSARRPWPRPPQRCCPATFARFSRRARVACWSCPSAIPELRRMRRCRSAIRMTSPRGDGRSS